MELITDKKTKNRYAKPSSLQERLTCGGGALLTLITKGMQIKAIKHYSMIYQISKE